MKARTYKKLLRLNQDEQERLRYLSKSTGLNQEQVLRKVSLLRPAAESLPRQEHKALLLFAA